MKEFKNTPFHGQFNVHETVEKSAVSSTKSSLQKKADQSERVQSIAQLQKKADQSQSHLPLQLKQNIESASGFAMDDVNVHYNSSQPAQLQAHAFAQGTDIHLGPGQEQHLPHEAWHVVQQKQGRVRPTKQTGTDIHINDDESLEKEADIQGERMATKASEVPKQLKSKGGHALANSPVQMLKKSSHPWTGAVIDTSLLAFRDKPNGTTLADLPQKTLTNVEGVSGNWLKMTVDTSQKGVVLNSTGKSNLSGKNLTAYSYHKYVDDAAAAEMTELLGENAKWVPSGPTSGNTFQSWASASTEAKAPPVNAITTINCWEMVILAAYRIKAISWKWIHDLYMKSPSTWYDELPKRLTSGANKTYDLATKTPSLERGDVVFFDGAAHVALATGNGDEIMTFWPPPNTAFTSGGTVDEVKKSTIKELSDWMGADFGAVPKVTFGTPAW